MRADGTAAPAWVAAITSCPPRPDIKNLSTSLGVPKAAAASVGSCSEVSDPPTGAGCSGTDLLASGAAGITAALASRSAELLYVSGACSKIWTTVVDAAVESMQWPRIWAAAKPLSATNHKV